MAETCNEHSAHQRAISQHDKRLGSHGAEIDELRDCVVRLTALQEANAAWQESADERNAAWRESADERLSALEAKPAKRWETVTNYIFTAVIALIVGVIAGQIGLN